MSISFKEILGNNQISDVPIAIQHNIDELLKCVNKLRDAWGKPLIVTSGLRTMNQHLRIYSEMNIFPPNVPMKSRHLTGNAVDFADPTGNLYTWALLNEAGLEEWGLWAEAGTKGWLHVQNVPYGSYKPGHTRFFKA